MACPACIARPIMHAALIFFGAAGALVPCIASVSARLPLAHGVLLDVITMAMTLIAALGALACWHACTWYLAQRQHQLVPVATFHFCAESAR